MSAARLLETARAAGLSFEVEGQDLIVEADRDPPPELIASLRQHKAELIAFLASPRGRPSSGPNEQALRAGSPIATNDLEEHTAIAERHGGILHGPSDPAWWHDF